MRVASDIVLKPIISEKSLQEAAIGRYSFLVARDVGKHEIKQAIHKLFQVDVKKIHTSMMKKGGQVKMTRFGKRRVGSSQKGFKKARVEVAKGQKIELFEELMKKGK